MGVSRRAGISSRAARCLTSRSEGEVPLRRDLASIGSDARHRVRTSRNAPSCQLSPDHAARARRTAGSSVHPPDKSRASPLSPGMAGPFPIEREDWWIESATE